MRIRKSRRCLPVCFILVCSNFSLWPGHSPDCIICLIVLRRSVRCLFVYFPDRVNLVEIFILAPETLYLLGKHSIQILRTRDGSNWATAPWALLLLPIWVSSNIREKQLTYWIEGLTSTSCPDFQSRPCSVATSSRPSRTSQILSRKVECAAS